MDGIPIYYVMQPSTDDSLNVFFLPSSYKSQADVKIKDVITHFPHKDSGKFFHYRFYALCDKDQKTWVDISNMSAKAPVVENRILIKVLEIEKPHYSKMFSLVSKATREEPQQQQQTTQPEPRQQQQQQQQQSMNTSGQRPTQPRPTEERPKPPSNVTSPPKTQTTQSQPQPKPPVNVKSPPASAADYEDLLGGDSAPSSYSQPASTSAARTTFSPPQQNKAFDDDSDITKGMTREQLTVYKKQKMDQAIQDKLEFANKIWADENKNQEDKAKAYDELEDKIKNWSGKNGQRNNIRALLCTVHEVMWQGADWQALSLSDLMMPKQIKVNYFKAITKFHPDKNQGGDYRQRYIAERVTNELNAAWDEFRKTNP